MTPYLSLFYAFASGTLTGIGLNILVPFCPTGLALFASFCLGVSTMLFRLSL